MKGWGKKLLFVFITYLVQYDFLKIMYINTLIKILMK